MNNFNICEAFFSGFYFFREQFSSSALGYVLSPFSTGGTEPLKRFVEALYSTQDKYKELLEELLCKLNSGKELTAEKHFVNKPLDSDKNISSALEFKQIDVLIRIDDIILLFENKIYEESVGQIGKQVKDYKISLGENWQKRTIPFAIFPKLAKHDFDDIISISWNGNEVFTLGKFFKELSVQYPVLKDFVCLIENDFSLKSRDNNTERKNYEQLINEFNEGYPDIIREVFPQKNVALGEDMAVGGSLLYRHFLKKANDECFPFRLLVNGKCEIQYHGLRKKIFLSGLTFDGKHTIKDIIREFLSRKGVKFSDKYYFDYTEFQYPEKVKAFKEVLELLDEIDDKMWDKNKFNDYYLELTKAEIPAAELKKELQKCLEMDPEMMTRDLQKYHELYRAAKMILSEK